jgi:gephyrin
MHAFASDGRTDARDADRMIHPADARRIVLAAVSPLPIEHLPVSAAVGRVLAADAVADADSPPFAAATMDGYAVVAADVSPWREVVGDQTAGFVLQARVSEGYAVRITTGAPVPAGADAVVPVEQTEPADDHVVIHRTDVAVGENIRAVGSDLARGDTAVPAGTELGPAELALVASLGIDPVPVRRRPRVTVLSTGDELVEPSSPVGPGQIRDANRFGLLAALRMAGADVIGQGLVRDDRAALLTALESALAASDVLVTSGGVSMGALDLVKPLLGELADVRIRRVFMKPGKPFTFAVAPGCLVFGLPGNPVSALVSFETFIRPALRSMLGCAEIDRPRVPVVLEAPAPPTDRIEMQRAAVRVDGDGVLRARPTGSQASSRLASFVGANALLVIPPRDTAYDVGELVEAVLLAPPVPS